MGWRDEFDAELATERPSWQKELDGARNIIDEPSLPDDVKFGYVKQKTTEEGSIDPELPELITGVPSEVSLMGRAKISAGLMAGQTTRQQVEIIKSALDEDSIKNKFRFFDDGTVEIEIGDKGEKYALNQVGVSLQDVGNTLTAATMIGFPGMKAGQVATKILGATGLIANATRIGAVAAADGIASVTTDLGAQALGSTEPVSLTRAAISAAAPPVLESLAVPLRLGFKSIGHKLGGMPDNIVKSMDVVNGARVKNAEDLGVHLTLGQATDNLALKELEKQLAKHPAATEQIMKTLKSQNQQVEIAVKDLLDNIAPQKDVTLAGFKTVKALQKNVDSFKKGRKDFADKMYSEALKEGTQIDIGPVRAKIMGLRSADPKDITSAIGFAEAKLSEQSMEEITKKGIKTVERMGDEILETLDNIVTKGPKGKKIQSGTVTKRPILDEDGKVISRKTEYDLTTQKVDKALDLTQDMRQLHKANVALGKKIKNAIGTEKYVLKEIQDTLVEQMSKASPAYKAAVNNYRRQSGIIEAVEKGRIGGLTGKVITKSASPLDFAGISDVIFKEGAKDPQLLLRTKKILDGIDPKIMPALLRYDIQSKLSKISQASVEGIPNTPGRLFSEIFDNPRSEIAYKMVLPPQTLQFFNALSDTLQAASTARPGGSTTTIAKELMGDQRMAQGLKNELFKPLDTMANIGVGKMRDRRLSAMAEIMTSPNHKEALEKLISKPGKPLSPAATRAFMALVRKVEQEIMNMASIDDEY